MMFLKRIRAATLSLAGLGLMVLGACASAPASAQVQTAPAQTQSQTQTPARTTSADASDMSQYRLGSADEIKIAVFGEPQLSGNFIVDGQGFISLSLIGELQVKDMTLREVQRLIETKLKDGYLRDPQVSAEMVRGRPYYVLGEVNRPGQYDFTSGLTVMNAIATAGDFTYRADKRRVFIKSADSDAEREVRLTVSTPVRPGDTIRIRERFF